MSASATIQVAGVKDTINALRAIDPSLQKEFKADAISIAQPAVSAAKAVYTQVPLSGMQYGWASRGRQLFPFKIDKATKGVQVKFDSRRNAVGVILIEQKDPAAAIFETAGRANANKLGNQLGFVGAGRTRLIGPAVYKARRGIEQAMVAMIEKTQTEIQGGLR
jgi:hypothetical protein